MKKILLVTLATAMALSLFTSCNGQNATAAEGSAVTPLADTVQMPYRDFTYQVDPATFDIVIDQGGRKEHASVPMKRRPFTDLKRETNRIEWTYPQEKVKVVIDKQGSYLDVRIHSLGAKQFAWPTLEADSYMLPLWEGKRIPSNDPSWKSFLQGETFTWLESFSMNFMALNKQHYALVYVVKNPFNNEVSFETNPTINMTFTH